MQDQLISFETAKLAKEAGFDRYGLRSYDGNGDFVKTFDCPKYMEGLLVPLATQSLMQKWLREEHEIYLTVIPVGHSDYELKYYYYSILGVDCNDGKHEVNRFITFEEALEAGLQIALNKINKKQ